MLVNIPAEEQLTLNPMDCTLHFSESFIANSGSCFDHNNKPLICKTICIWSDLPSYDCDRCHRRLTGKGKRDDVYRNIIITLSELLNGQMRSTIVVIMLSGMDNEY